MKVRLVFTLLVLFSLINVVNALETEDVGRDFCLPLSNENLIINVGFYPEIEVIYISAISEDKLNPTNPLNITFFLLADKRALGSSTLKLPSLKPNGIFCDFIPLNTSITNNSIYNNNNLSAYIEIAGYYSNIFDIDFRVDKCIDINRWNRIKSLEYNGNAIIKDTLIFKKICNDSFDFNIKFQDLDISQIPIKTSKIFYSSTDTNIFVYSIPNEERIIVPLDESLPIDTEIVLELEYYLPYDDKDKEFWIMSSYPLTNLFFELNTGNFVPEEAYLSFEDGRIMNIRDAAQYSIEINIPEGFTYADEPNESYYDKISKQIVLKSDTEEKPGVIYPNPSCLNIEEFPVECVKYIYNPTPKHKSSQSKIIWASSIFNGEPNKLSYPIEANLIYIILFFILFFVSILLLLRINDENTLIVTLGYFFTFVWFRLSARNVLGAHLTLFDYLFIIIVFLIIINIKKYIRRLLKSNLKNCKMKEFKEFFTENFKNYVIAIVGGLVSGFLISLITIKELKGLAIIKWTVIIFALGIFILLLISVVIYYYSQIYPKKQKSKEK